MHINSFRPVIEPCDRRSGKEEEAAGTSACPDPDLLFATASIPNAALLRQRQRRGSCPPDSALSAANRTSPDTSPGFPNGVPCLSRQFSCDQANVVQERCALVELGNLGQQLIENFARPSIEVRLQNSR